MPDIAIRVENLSKQYRIGARLDPHATLRDRLADVFTAPVRRADPHKTEADTFWALKDVSFEVKRGEVVGIIGRNGAGKSTLLKILSRITKPTSGRAEIHGRVASLLEVGTGFHPELTGRENITLNGAILGMKRREIERKFDEIVAFAEVEKFIDTPVKHYSSGMYVRLAFAVAAHLEPEILLVDEVLAVGDAAFQKKCLGKMGEAAKDGRTVVFVSHNMTAVQELCGQTFLIQKGQIIEHGSTEKVISEYMSDALDSASGDFDYSHHPARQNQHQPIIRRVVLRGENGLPSTSFYPHSSLQIDLFIYPPSILRNPRLAVAIEDYVGRRIMTVASYFGQENFPDIADACCVRCVIPKLKLGTGRYLLSVSIATKYTGLLDSVDGGAWFDVSWQNNYSNGEVYQSVYGPVLVDSEWIKLS